MPAAGDLETGFITPSRDHDLYGSPVAVISGRISKRDKQRIARKQS
jgi:hypothetical protein